MWRSRFEIQEDSSIPLSIGLFSAGVGRKVVRGDATSCETDGEFGVLFNTSVRFL